MEYSPIYNRYRIFSDVDLMSDSRLLVDRHGSLAPTSFENTLRLIQDLLNERLSLNCRKIRVQGSNSGKVRICITTFPTVLTRYPYQMFFQDYPTFRHFRPDAESIGPEIANIENIIERLRSGVLSGIIE